MANIELSTFPSNRIDALTMLYLEKQDLKGMRPSELTDLYTKVYIEIKEQFRVQSSDNNSVVQVQP